MNGFYKKIIQFKKSIQHKNSNTETLSNRHHSSPNVYFSFQQKSVKNFFRIITSVNSLKPKPADICVISSISHRGLYNKNSNKNILKGFLKIGRAGKWTRDLFVILIYFLPLYHWATMPPPVMKIVSYCGRQFHIS